MRGETKLLIFALVGTIFFVLLHSDSLRQKTVALVEPVHVDLLNYKNSLELINTAASDSNVLQNASVYDTAIEKSGTEGIKSQLGGVHNLTRIKNSIVQIKDHSVEAVTQRDLDFETTQTSWDQGVEALEEISVEALAHQDVEAVTQARGQDEVPVTQLRNQDVTQIKEDEQIHTQKNIPSTVRSAMNTLQPSSTSVTMHQTTQRPFGLLSSLHAPPSFPWLQGEMKSNPERVMLFEWIKDLKSFLISVDVRCPIAIVASDSHYADALLNWLIMSTVTLEDPIKNILILSLDSSLHQLLQNRSIKSLHILPSSLAVIKPNRFRPLKQVEVVRFTVMRLLNYWGFDVANYDSDAMIMKNPQPIYDRYSEQDVIGSAGYFPPEIHRKWGVTLCMGAVMIRATKQTGTIIILLN